MNEFSVKRVSIDSKKTPIDQPQKQLMKHSVLQIDAPIPSCLVVIPFTHMRE